MTVSEKDGRDLIQTLESIADMTIYFCLFENEGLEMKTAEKGTIIVLKNDRVKYKTPNRRTCEFPLQQPSHNIYPIIYRKPYLCLVTTNHFVML